MEARTSSDLTQNSSPEADIPIGHLVKRYLPVGNMNVVRSMLSSSNLIW